MTDLFGGLLEPPEPRPSGPDLLAEPATDAPLAVRMRPRTLADVVGQDHVTGPGGPLAAAVRGAVAGLLLWGPPGCGKTTLASLVAARSGAAVRVLSAVDAGVRDVRAEVEAARRRRERDGTRTVLFVDEVHRFSRTQQDSLLGPVEHGHVTLLGATTENPVVNVVAPLLSRCLLVVLRALDDDAVGALVDRAVGDAHGLAGRVRLHAGAREELLALARGDGRRALSVLEAAASLAAPSAVSSGGDGLPLVDVAAVRAAAQGAAPVHSRDDRVDVTSAFIKSMRGGDADATLHWLARLLEAGEDPRYVARRLVVHASEDVGLADPSCLRTAVAAADALDRVGLPEGRIPLAQAALHVALAPKSPSVVAGIDAALADVRAGRTGPVPPALRGALSAGAVAPGAEGAYRSPHDDPRGVVEQQHLPDGRVDAVYYRPSGAGAEQRFAQRHAELQEILRPSSRPSGWAQPTPGAA